MSKESNNAFEKIAPDYDKGRKSENVEYWSKETRSLAQLKDGDLVLDLGCGTGVYSKGLRDEINAIMCGLDPSIEMLRLAKQKSKDIHWLEGVGEFLPLRNSLFDSIFSSQVWHHIQEKQLAARECGRVLKKGGKTIIRTISHDQLHKKIVFQYFPEIKENQLRVYPSDEEFLFYFKNAGFESTEFQKYSLKRYQKVEELIEIAEKRLWSMFRSITQEGLEEGIKDLHRYYHESGGMDVRNDELITLVISQK